MQSARLSAVIASQDAEQTIADCLGGLLADANRAGVELEIVVADGSLDRSRERARRACPAARILELSPQSLVPELWSSGIGAAHGTAIALTTAHCIPQPGWVNGMLEILADGYGGAGGGIRCDARAKMLDRAIYFTRYSAYLPPFPAADAEDLPGDNACYDASTLRRFPAYIEGAFWEPFLHAEMRGAGIRLRIDPRPAVTYVHSYPFARFTRLRFAHGWHFGRERGRGESRHRSLARGLIFPLLPPLLVARVIRRVSTRGAADKRFWLCLPLVTLFLASFAAGECSAALSAALSGSSGGGRA